MNWLTMNPRILSLIIVMTISQQVLAEECLLVDKECVEQGETRNINGVNVYKDCWAYKNIYSCLTELDESQDGCRTLNNAHIKNKCDPVKRECDESVLSLNGIYKCLNEAENWVCDEKIELPENNAEWTGKEVVYDERIETSDCGTLAKTSGCTKTNRKCSEEGKLAEGYGNCEQYYECGGVEISACDTLKNVGCTEEMAPTCPTEGTACAMKEGLVKCSGDRGSIIPKYLDANFYKIIDSKAENVGSPAVVTSDCLAYIDGQLDSGCKQTSSKCTDKGGIKKINGRTYYERCWGYTRQFACSAREYSTCGSLETSSIVGGCKLSDDVCVAESDDGKCLEREKIYLCDTNLKFNDAILVGTQHLLNGYGEYNGCQTEIKDENCNLISSECEAFSSNGDGVCIQYRYQYKCKKK